MTAPPGPGHWMGGVLAVVRPPSVGAATGVPLEPGEPEPPPPTSPPPGGLDGVGTGGDVTGPGGAVVGGVVPPGEVGGVVPPGSAGGVVPPGAVPDPSPFGLPVPADTEGVVVRSVGGVLIPTTDRPEWATNRSVGLVTVE